MFHRPNPSNNATSNATPTQPEKESMTTQTTPDNSSDATAAASSVDIPTSGGNPFQRTSAPATPARPAIPSYGATASAYPSYGSPSSSSAAASGRRLVIGKGITMSGEIESCDHLVVEGTVEAALKGANILEIAEEGMFYGTVEISEATIAGKFEGEITVNGRLTIRAGGSVIGAITYKELAVEAGAVIDGKINPVGGSKGASSEKKSRNGKASANATEELPMLARAAG